jgi:branched-chain amino acid transport system substrate-binding protein
MQWYLSRSGPRRHWRVPALVAAFALVLAACGGGEEGGGGAAATVKIAYFGVLTGDASPQLGINIRNGAKLAVDEFNAKGGATKVELVEYDSQGDPAQAPQLAQRAVTEKVAGIVGPAFSGESRVANPIFEEAKIPNVSPSATGVSLAANGWKYYHRIVANDDVQSAAVAEYMTKKLAAKKVAAIDDKSEYGKGLADGVRKALGGQGTQVVNESIDPKATDYSSVVNAVKSAAPEAIYYGGYYQEAAKLLKQLRDGGIQATFVSGDGSLDQQLITLGGAAAEGAIATCACVLANLSTDEKAKKFLADYKAKFNADPGTYSTEGYDAAGVFLKAIEAGKTTAEDINAWLATATVEGLTKQIKFEANGEVSAGDVFVYEAKGGKISLLGPVAEVAK